MGDSRLGKPSKKSKLERKDKLPVSIDELVNTDDGAFYEYERVKRETLCKSGVPRVARGSSDTKSYKLEDMPTYLEQEGLSSAKVIPGISAIHMVKNEMQHGDVRVFRPSLVPCQVEKIAASGKRAHVILDPEAKRLRKVVNLDSLFVKKAS